MRDCARPTAVVAGVAALALVALASAGSASAADQPKTIRGGHTEVFVFAQTHSNDTAASKEIAVETDDGFAYGGGIGFNINERLNFNTSIWGSANDQTLTTFGAGPQGSERRDLSPAPREESQDHAHEHAGAPEGRGQLHQGEDPVRAGSQPPGRAGRREDRTARDPQAERVRGGPPQQQVALHQ